MLDFLTLEETAYRLIFAVGCAVVLGFEREIKHKNAGIRTYLLVCLGSAGFTILIINISAYFLSLNLNVQIDPSRIVQGIVTGLGFLGGGAILQQKSGVTGVATGAGIWIVGAIGIACGFGFFQLASLLTLLAFAVLGVIGLIRARMRDDIDNNSDKGDVSGDATN